MKGFVTNIQRFCVHDGPGIRTTVFLKGCPLSCAWCQNPETIKPSNEIFFSERDCIGCKRCTEVCPQRCFKWGGELIFDGSRCDQCGICVEECPSNALRWVAKEMSPDDVMREVMRDWEYYKVSGGGCTLSGGEPLYQHNFSYELAKKLKEAGIHVVVDTSGYAPSDIFDKMLSVVDLFLYDLKFINEGLHKKWTGAPNEIILRNFKIVCESGKNVVVRVPLIKGVTDIEHNISDIKKITASGKIKVEFIPFNKMASKKYEMLGRRPTWIQKN